MRVEGSNSHLGGIVSLYSEYIGEQTKKSIIETEKGFVTYSFPDKTTVYIEDIYIKPEHRKTHEASNLANQVVSIAKERGCTRLLGSVVPSTNNSTKSLLVLTSYGMKLSSSTNDFIVFEKEI